jgi:hypothetical protein
MIALFRANTKNAVVLEQYLREKGAKALKAQGRPVPALDPSDPAEFDRHLIEETGPPPSYTSGPPTRQGTNSNGHGRPSQERVQEERGGGWFSGFGSKRKQPDVERGGRREDAPLPAAPTGFVEAPVRNKSTLQKSRP